MEESKEMHQADACSIENQVETEQLEQELVLEEDSTGESTRSQEELLAEIERLQAESDQHQQRLLRLQADFDNYRRRTREEKAELIQSANASLLEALLPVLDNLERAIQSGSEHLAADDPFVDGVEMVKRQMLEIFKQHGVEPMETIGKPFDPYFHQAVMQEPSEHYDTDTIIEEFQKGYTLHGKALRVAMVKVAK